jgi:hypothetical protein
VPSPRSSGASSLARTGFATKRCGPWLSQESGVVKAQKLGCIGWNGLACAAPTCLATVRHPRFEKQVRARRPHFLDIALDFVFYASIPLAFAIHNPDGNALPAAVLLASFLANGGAFFAFANVAAKLGLTTSAQGLKVDLLPCRIGRGRGDYLRLLRILPMASCLSMDRLRVLHRVHPLRLWSLGPGLEDT